MQVVTKFFYIHVDGGLGDYPRVEVVGKWMFVNTQFWNKEIDVGTLQQKLHIMEFNTTNLILLFDYILVEHGIVFEFFSKQGNIDFYSDFHIQIIM